MTSLEYELGEEIRWVFGNQEYGYQLPYVGAVKLSHRDMKVSQEGVFRLVQHLDWRAEHFCKG